MNFFGHKKLIVLFSILLTTGAHAATTAKASSMKVTAPKRVVIQQARALLQNQDYLGFRIWVHKAYATRINAAEWFEMRNLINAFADRAGFDLIPLWNSRYPKGKAQVDKDLEKADALMAARHFEEAFVEYQKIAEKVKQLEKTRGDAKRIYPFVIHAMARALFGAGRYTESVQVYQWISSSYPWFRQVMFEKMWAAFNGGNVEIALGAIASQHSAYFSKYLAPEAYLIQTYLYRKLCREDDLKSVIIEMKQYETLLSSNAGLDDWSSSDIERLVLRNLTLTDTAKPDTLKWASVADRTAEKAQINHALKTAFEHQRGKILADLKTALAYADLAKVTDTRTLLKPVTALKSRDELLKQNLEVWPATSEEWGDEIGKHVFIGESSCEKGSS
jgi:tetratricopeptide (TPR) repeat protein